MTQFANLQFPYFAVRSNPTSGSVLTLAGGERGPVLPLFSDPQWAADFARRHSSPMVPSVPLSPKLLHELLTGPLWEVPPADIWFDPIDNVITAQTKVFSRDKLIERLERMRDGTNKPSV